MKTSVNFVEFEEKLEWTGFGQIELQVVTDKVILLSW